MKSLVTCNTSKGQQISKYFFPKTPLPPKQTKYLTKFCPRFIGQNTSFVFWAMEFQEKLF